MRVSPDKPQKGKAVTALSVNMYNDWFLNFAPQAFRTTRIQPQAGSCPVAGSQSDGLRRTQAACRLVC